MGQGPRAFPTTHWSGILEIRARSQETARRLVEGLLQQYWAPVYGYVRAAGGLTVEDAKDLTQAFFARFLEKELLAQLDPSRGSFRGFLKRSVRNFLVDAKRAEGARQPRGERNLIPIGDWHEVDVPANVEPEDLFDREWTRSVLRTAVAELESRMEAREQSVAFQAFRAYCLADSELHTEGVSEVDPPREGKLTYATLGEELGVTENAIRKGLERCRRELRKIVEERVLEYVTGEEEAEEEMRLLLGIG